MLIQKDFFKIYSDNLPVVKHTFDFNAKKDNASPLTVYNFNSRSNDVYFLQNGTYVSTSPSVNLEDNWIVSRTDSFNPSGAPDFGSAVVMGLINVFFEEKHFKLGKNRQNTK
jgi:hypothetical protein